MSLAYYMDENVERAISLGLAGRGVDVLRAQDDGHSNTPDEIVFQRANALGRVLVSEDADMLVYATSQLRAGEGFTGVVFWHQQTLSIGTVIRDLELLSLAGFAEDVRNRVTFLPL